MITDQTDPSTSNRSNRPLYVALAAGLALCLLRFNTIPVGTFFDDAAYLILAESLANFEGYRLINFSYAPVEQAFPPGWPILLAPLAAVFPGNLLLPRLFALACAMGSVWLSDILFRPRLTETQRWMFLLLVALNPFLVGSAGTVMSEPAYLFLSLLTLVMLDRYLIGPGHARFMWIGLGLAFFAMVVRTLGISILMTAVIALIPKKHWRKAVITGGLLAVAGVLILVFAPNGFGTVYLLSPTYQGHIQYLSGEILNYLQVWNFLPTFNYPMISAMVLPIFDLNLSFIPYFDTLRSAGAVVLLLCVLWGFALNVPQWRPSEIYFILFAAIFYMWTAYINEIQQRQLVPMIPFLSFYFISFLAWVLGKVWPEERSAMGQKALVGICVVILAAYGARHFNELSNPVRNLIVDYELGGKWLKENLAEDEIYAVNYPRPSYLYYRRQSDFLPGNFEPDAIDAYMTERNISYVVIQPGLADWNTGELIIEPQYVEFLVPHLDQRSDRYSLVFEDEAAKISIYEVLKR